MYVCWNNRARTHIYTPYKCHPVYVCGWIKIHMHRQSHTHHPMISGSKYTCAHTPTHALLVSLGESRAVPGAQDQVRAAELFPLRHGRLVSEGEWDRRCCPLVDMAGSSALCMVTGWCLAEKVQAAPCLQAHLRLKPSLRSWEGSDFPRVRVRVRCFPALCTRPPSRPCGVGIAPAAHHVFHRVSPRVSPVLCTPCPGLNLGSCTR